MDHGGIDVHKVASQIYDHHQPRGGHSHGRRLRLASGQVVPWLATTAGSDEPANQQLGLYCLPVIAVIVFLFT